MTMDFMEAEVHDTTSDGVVAPGSAAGRPLTCRTEQTAEVAIERQR